MQPRTDYKQIIANNLLFLLKEHDISRKELCDETGIKYTTLCDWLNGRTYPRLDALELVSGYFALNLPDLFIDLEHDVSHAHLAGYARRLSMTTQKDFTDMYPEDFFDLYGAADGLDFEEPEDFPVDETDFNL